MLFNRLLPYLTTLLVFGGFEILFKEPTWIYLIIAGLIIWVAFTVWKLLGLKSIAKLTQWNFLITPVILILSAGLFFVFIERIIIKHILFLSVAVLIGLFLETLFIYIYQHENYRSGILENISNLINLISFYFYFSGIYGLAIFLNLPFWLITIMALPIIVILIYGIFWINKIPATKKSRLFVLTISLILVELAMAIKSLPSSFYVNGFILTFAFYVMINLSSRYLLDSLKKSMIAKYLIIGSLMLLLVLATAQWT